MTFILLAKTDFKRVAVVRISIEIQRNPAKDHSNSWRNISTFIGKSMRFYNFQGQ